VIAEIDAALRPDAISASKSSVAWTLASSEPPR
jgi:hypothetical protein